MPDASKQPTHHGYAVNVKDDSLYRDVDRGSLSESEVQAIYDDRAEDFWELIQDVARYHGFAGAYSAGRSSGWCQPHPQPSIDSVGPESELSAWVESKFRPFERDCLALMAGCREEYLSDLARAVKSANREPIERAYWEARDVVTVDA
jgi:hypothetical protein